MSDEAVVIDDTKPKRRGRAPGSPFAPRWMRWPFAVPPEQLLTMRQEQFVTFKNTVEEKFRKVCAARDASAGLTD